MSDEHHPIDVSTCGTKRSQFLLLVDFMGRDFVREDILRRGLLPQYRWDHNGNRTTASQTDIGEFAELFVDEDALNQEIYGCTNGGLIKKVTLEDETQCYTLTGGFESCGRYRKSRQLWIALLTFVAYIYPRDHALEQS